MTNNYECDCSTFFSTIGIQNQKKGNFLTRSTRFCKLVDYVYNVCDADKTGQIGKSELYAGLLLVHLNLAKYAGPAACFVSRFWYCCYIQYTGSPSRELLQHAYR